MSHPVSGDTASGLGGLLLGGGTATTLIVGMAPCHEPGGGVVVPGWPAVPHRAGGAPVPPGSFVTDEHVGGIGVDGEVAAPATCSVRHEQGGDTGRAGHEASRVEHVGHGPGAIE